MSALFQQLWQRRRAPTPPLHQTHAAAREGRKKKFKMQLKRKMPPPSKKEVKTQNPVPKRPRNAKTRKRLPNATKRKLVLEYESMEDSMQRVQWLEDHQISRDTMKGWRKPKTREQLMTATSTKSQKQKTSSSHREKQQSGHFVEEQKLLYNMYRLRRAEGLTVSGNWFVGKMHEILANKKPNGYEKFKGSTHWINNFVKRWGITHQQKTNKKSKSVEERLPRVQRFHQYAVYQMALEKP